MKVNDLQMHDLKNELHMLRRYLYALKLITEDITSSVDRIQGDYLQAILKEDENGTSKMASR